MYVFDTCVFGEKLQLYSRGSRASIKKQYLTIEPWSTQKLHCSHPTHSFHNQSCRAKQSESTGKTMGAGARPTGPFRAAEGPVWTPNAQITSHIMRGLAQQALPPFLSLLSPSLSLFSHTHTQIHVTLLLKSCSVLSGYYTDYCQHSCFTCQCLAQWERQEAGVGQSGAGS